MAYSRNQKHRNQSDTNVRNHNPKKKSFKRKKRLTREDFQIPGLPRAVKVPDGNIEQALRRFKKMMKQTDVITELKERREYIKPSKKRYMERKRAAGIQKKRTKRMVEMDKKHVWTVIHNGQAK